MLEAQSTELPSKSSRSCSLRINFTAKEERELKQQYQAPKPSRRQRLQDLVATNSLDIFIFV
eukprot:4856337-Ditylum_brightwellii.AAC.1